MVSDLLPCPFCGEKPQITKHHREDIYSFMHRCQVLGPISWGFREDQQAHIEKWNARAQPAQQPHPEPIAWMVGTAIWWTKEEAERDAAATGLPIVGLGPMSGVAPSEQNQGEPYGWAHDEGKEFTTHADHASDLQREGIQMLPLYTHAEPAEVERLRLERRRMDQALSACANERDALRALLVEALAFLDEAYKHDIGTQLKREIKAFYLSASVEPSAPVLKRHHDVTMFQRGEAKP
ncbi:Lar family restriction alleviation protein [Pseudomonas putida]|nr:Lar family restriction alleviation protein [Pseudomonas putida]